MAKKRSYYQELLERHRNIPLCSEYKEIFFAYMKLFLKWMKHINHALDDLLELREVADTAAGMRKVSELENEINELCWNRDGILVVLSMIAFIGMNTPTTSTLTRLQRLHTTIDDNLLARMVIISRYKKAILEKKRLSLRGCTIPVSFGDIQKSDDWPDDALLDACFINGEKMMNLVSYKKEKK